jgi:hypothetical protein
MAQKSCTRAAPNSAALSVWSGWWWLNTTSVTASGSTPEVAQRVEDDRPGRHHAGIDDYHGVAVADQRHGAATRSPT